MILGVGAIITALSDMINTLFLKIVKKPRKVEASVDNIEIIDEN
jgi:hypothetical protein